MIPKQTEATYTRRTFLWCAGLTEGPAGPESVISAQGSYVSCVRQNHHRRGKAFTLLYSLKRAFHQSYCLSGSIQLRSIQLVSPNRISRVCLMRLSSLGSSGTSAPSALSPARIGLASGASRPGSAHRRPCARKRRPQNCFPFADAITAKRIALTSVSGYV